MNLESPKVLFIVNVDWFFLSHRLPIALAAQLAGYEVHVATGVTNCEAIFDKYNIPLHPIYLDRGSTMPIGLLRSFFDIFCVIYKLHPDIVHLITIKPVLIGAIVTRALRIKNVVCSVSGLGFVFVAQGLKAKLRRYLVEILYRFAFDQPAICVIFQNHIDQYGLCRIAELPHEKSILIPGSGVDLSLYRPSALPSGDPIILFAARLLSSKGVYEFVEAARNFKNTRFVIVGQFDKDNRDCIKPSQLDSWVHDRIVEYWGFSGDMFDIINQASIVVLPSYREGLPKVLIEAAACGKAVITTDVPGCRDAIEPGISGLLVPPRDANALAAAIEKLLNDPDLCKSMGLAGRALAERKFDIKQVVQTHLDSYADMLSTIS